MTRALSLFILLFYFPAMADDTSAIERFSVLGQKESLPTQPGSAHIIDDKEMEKFSFSDIHRLLQKVPGVNLQEEEGFGLRPNIGLRGAHPHRSKKITLMEDGVLIAPAPYAAPAAYYFPSLEKLQSLEVFKGATSVPYGPQSIGGAINMITRVQPHGARFNAEYGSFQLQKYQALFGIESFGDLTLQLNRSSSDGFKELPSGSDTGFEKHNIFLRWDKFFAPGDQNLTIKLNWSNEKSRSSYLGVTEDDFQENPFQRYASSENDEMTWEHKQFFLSYAISPLSSWRLRSTIYRHEFSRDWDKLDGFFDQSLSMRDILNNPSLSSNTYFYQVLKGDQNTSLPANQDVLRLTDNQRSFWSQGVQLQSKLETPFENWGNKLTVSYRLHQDHVQRNHVSSFFNMTQRQLVASSLPQETLKKNKGMATAHTLSIYNEMDWDKLFLSFGGRGESISYEQTNLLTDVVEESSDQFLVGGFGLFYELFPGGGLLAGAHQGFTPVGPGQADNIKPEEAMNYELGFRYSGDWGVELISFFSDYQNISGTCTQSSSCSTNSLDQQFNGGEAKVYGVEALLSFNPQWKSLSFPVRWSATFTQAQFANDFTSVLEDWGLGDVKVGDPIPYIPPFQTSLSLGGVYKKWSLFLDTQYVSAVADQAVSQGRKEVSGRVVIDSAMHYNFSHSGRVYFKINNLLDNKYIVSFRPFGARPGRPQSFFVGLNYEL